MRQKPPSLGSSCGVRLPEVRLGPPPPGTWSWNQIRIDEKFQFQQNFKFKFCNLEFCVFVLCAAAKPEPMQPLHHDLSPPPIHLHVLHKKEKKNKKIYEKNNLINEFKFVYFVGTAVIFSFTTAVFAASLASACSDRQYHLYPRRWRLWWRPGARHISILTVTTIDFYIFLYFKTKAESFGFWC